MGGITIEMDDPEAVKELLLAGSRSVSQPAGRAHHPSGGRTGEGGMRGMSGLRLLKEIQKIKAGVSTKVLLKNTTNGRGIGPILHSVRLALKGSALAFEEVVEKNKVNGVTLWFPGPKMAEGIQYIEKGLKARLDEDQEVLSS